MIAPDRTDRIRSQRLSLSYCEWGKTSAPPLVLVHGGRDQKRSWDRLAGALQSNYRVIAFDLRGHGKSDWANDGDYSVMDHVFDLASLVDALELEQFTLIGHSLGGNIALRFTGLFPERVEKLVAIEGLGPSPRMLAARQALSISDRLTEWIDLRRSASERSPRVMQTVEEAQGRMQAAFPHLPDALIRHLTETGVKENLDGTVSWAYDPACVARSPSDISNDDVVQLWRQIACPTWLVYGENSWASNPAEDGRAKPFQSATVSLIADAGHWLHHDQFDDFLSRLNRFLGIIPPAA